MDRLMYFGTRERMTWVKCPAFNADLSKNKWNTSGTYLNGGGYVRDSVTGHKVYNFAWNLTRSETIREIMDYAAKIYGDDLIYFLDPFAVTTNILPIYWSAPRLAREDAPSLIRDTRPTLVDTGANTLAYPTKSAVYTIKSDSVVKELYIPVPDGYAFHIGVHGTSTGTAAVQVLRVAANGSNGSTVNVPMNSVTSEQRTSTEISNVSGVIVRLTGVGVLTLAGMIAQIRPIGESVPSGNFISGQGNSGVRFDGEPTVSGYSSPEAQDLQSASALLREVGAWQ